MDYSIEMRIILPLSSFKINLRVMWRSALDVMRNVFLIIRIFPFKIAVRIAKPGMDIGCFKGATRSLSLSKTRMAA